MRKRIFLLITFVFISINHLFADNMVSDTIDNQTSQIVVTLPDECVKYCTKFATSDGPVYSYCIGGQAVLDISLCSSLSHIKAKDTIVTKCKIGNVAESISGYNEHGYFRHDFYLMYRVTVSYENVSEDMRHYADDILDNIKLLTHNLKPIRPKSRKTKNVF